MDAGARRVGARARRRQPAAGCRARETRARAESLVGGRARLSGGRGGRRQPPRRGAAIPGQSAGGEPFEPRRARTQRRFVVCRGQAAGLRGRGREGARHRPRLRGGLPGGRRARRAQLPLRRSRRADAPRSRARQPQSARAGRPRLASAAHRRRAGRACRARGVVQGGSVQQAHLQPVDDDGHARQVRHRARRRRRDAPAQGRGAGPAGLRDGAHAPGAQHAVGALRVHAARTDPDRDLSQARRFRRPDRRPARHDRCARRLLRPRGHFGFAQGASARRVPVGGDALARARARHHAADVQSARAAVAHRRDLGLRGEEGAIRVGPRDGRAVRRHAESRRNAEAARSERRVPEPEDDLAGLLPGVASGRAHCQRVRRRGDAQAAAHLRSGNRYRRRAQGRAEHRPGSAASGIRPDHRTALRRHAARDDGAGRSGSAARADRGAARARQREPAQLPRSDGARHRSAEGERAGRSDAGVRAGGGARARGGREGQPARADGGHRAREEGSPAGD